MSLLLVDLDDTVLPRAETFRAWGSSFLAGIDRSGELDWLIEVDQGGRYPRMEFCAVLIDHLELDHSPENLLELYYDTFLPTFTCPGVVADSLAKARRLGFKIGIVTNGDRRAQSGKIAAAGLSALVDAVCISEVEGTWKPDPEIFKLAASRCEESLLGAWMIGDNPETDIGGAFRCGLQTVWIQLGRPWPADLPFRPDHLANSFLAAVDIVLARSIT